MSTIRDHRWIVGVLTTIFASLSWAAPVDVVVPNTAGTASGPNVFIGPLANTQRTYQLLIHQDQLTDLIGARLVGLSFRLPEAANEAWPAAAVTYGNYDIHLSPGVAPADRSLVFAENIAGPRTQVRSGGLTFAAGDFPAGSAPNPFGQVIAFEQWPYTGGHLLIELRHDGSNGTSRNIDAFGTATAGYGNQYSAAWTGNYAGTQGAQGNFATVRIHAESDDGPVDDIIIGNLPEDNDDLAVDGIDASTWQAIGFTLPVDADTITGALTLRLGNYQGGAVVTLRDADPELDVPGPNILTGFTEAGPRGVAVSDVVFLPDTSVPLHAETRYWLVVSGDGAQTFNWHASDPGVTPTGLAEFDLYSTTADAGAAWNPSSVYTSLQFDAGSDLLFANGFEDEPK